MAAEETDRVVLSSNFYRDGFGKVIFIMASIGFAIALIILLSIYLYITIPPPVTFPVSNEMRVQPEVPLDKPYLVNSDLLQWVGEVLPQSFTFDFNRYNAQLKAATAHFTTEGWKIFLNQLNIYANYNNVQAYKLFINGSPAAAPFILKEGLLSGRYAWWVQMPVTINYAGARPTPSRTLTLQVLVVRVPTLNNLMGVAIDNVVSVSPASRQL